jgi:hypothetical protein
LREKKKMQKWVDRVSETSGVDFMEISKKDLNP